MESDGTSGKFEGLEIGPPGVQARSGENKEMPPKERKEGTQGTSVQCKLSFHN